MTRTYFFRKNYYFKNKILLRAVLLAVVCILFTSVILLSLFKTAKATSDNNVIRSFHCTSIQIEKNDSLWSIANRYFTDEYTDIDNYITLIKDANNLKTDTIHAGNYLVIPYYR
jgi:cell division protein YceG involved in septum cleavage